MAEPIRVLIHNDVTGPLKDRLMAHAPEIDIFTCETYTELPDLLARARPDIAYSVRFQASGYPREAMLGPHGPRWISVGGAGTDHLGQWDSTAVTVTNSSGVAAEMMAEYIIGCFLHFTLDLPGLQADKAAKHWNARRKVVPLQGKTLLIVGLGHTGQALAARAKAFGMQVIGTRARPQAMDHVDAVHPSADLLDLLPQADCVALCVPLIPATRHLIDARAVAAMKPGALFADVSRGGVVDHAALAEALTSGHLQAAALDVFETEPLPTDSPLWNLPNTVISPHCSSVYAEWATASFERFLLNLDRYITGKPLKNNVDPARGY